MCPQPVARQRRRACRLLALGGLSLACVLHHAPVAMASLRGQEHQQQQEKRQLNVYGFPDRRQKADPSTFPARVVGRLQFPDGMYCTGTLVGEQYVLTARHCFTDTTQNSLMLSRMRGSFKAGFTHGDSIAESTFQHVWYGSGVDDWAIIRLTEPLGIDLGYLMVANVSDPLQLVSAEASYRMFAYSNDKYAFTLGVDPACALLSYVLSVETGAEMYMTSCSGEAGSSGAAILDKDNHVVAVFVSALDTAQPPRIRVISDFNPRHPNFATPTAAFFDKYMKLPNIAEDSDGEEEGEGEELEMEAEAEGVVIADGEAGNQVDPSSLPPAATNKEHQQASESSDQASDTIIRPPANLFPRTFGAIPRPIFGPLVISHTPVPPPQKPAPQGHFTGLNNNYRPSPWTLPDPNGLITASGLQHDYSYPAHSVVNRPDTQTTDGGPI